MESQGRLVDVTTSYESHKRRLTFEVDIVSDDEINRLYGLDTLDIKAVRHTEKRSNTANAYHWKLCSLIAKATHAGLQETHKILMLRYGTMAENEGVADYRIVPKSYTPAEDEYRLLGGEVHLTDKSGVKVAHNMYWVMKESHLYDSKEMSDLIDGTVYEAKELGIETLPPDEVGRLVEMWEAYDEV